MLSLIDRFFRHRAPLSEKKTFPASSPAFPFGDLLRLPGFWPCHSSKHLLKVPDDLPSPDLSLHLIRHEVQSLRDRKSTRLNSSHGSISYAVFCLKTKK